jgi:restriction endonuclease Mrr
VCRNYAQGIDSKIVLTDGPALVKLMIEPNLGVSVSRV